AAFVYHALQFCNRFIEIVIVHSLQYSAFSARRQFRLVGAGRHPRSGQGFFLPLRPHPSSSHCLGFRPKNPKKKEREALMEPSGGMTAGRRG
ncbi:hypothetical protein, partial [Treponema socranskii]|uniref:hypothetical protein n=1 Tax=Treponema socranskii TaxID=53419 RepID=UPI0028E989CB